MPVANLRLNIRSVWSGSDDGSVRRASQAFDSVGSSVGRVFRFGRRALLAFGRLPGAVLLLAPAAFTLGKAALALVAGLAVLGSVVTAAVLPWVGLAVTAARNADKMGSAGARFQASAGRVRDAWMALTRRTASLTLGPITDVLEGAAAAIPKLEPLVRDLAPDFARMGRDIRDWLSGPGFARFLDDVREFGVPAFRNLASAGRDFLATVGVGFRAFLPLARDIAETIETGGARMRGFARGGGFERFLDSVKQDAPAVNRFLREAGNTLRTIGGLLDGVGPGVLGAVNTALDLFNRVDPGTLKNTVIGLFAGMAATDLFNILASVAEMMAAGTEVAGGAALSVAAGSLVLAGGPLFALAAAVEARAADMATRDRVRVDSSVLDRIRDVWGSVIKNGSTTVSGPSVTVAAVGMMGVGSTWATVVSAAGTPRVFTARADVTQFAAATSLMLIVWNAVRLAVLFPPRFTARADATQFAAATSLLLIVWNAVRLAAASPVTFTATASPGNLLGVAAAIVTQWNAVRLSAGVVPSFTASANGSAVTSAASGMVSAWARVTSMPRTWAGTARVNAGPAVAGSARTVAAWRNLYVMPRSWSASASVTLNNGFTGIPTPGGGRIGGGGSFGGGRGDPGVVSPSGPTPFPSPILDFLLRQRFGDSGTSSGPGPGDSADSFIDSLFDVGLGIFRAQGGPVGSMSRAGTHKSSGRHVHIYGDMWFRNVGELTDFLERAIAQLD